MYCSLPSYSMTAYSVLFCSSIHSQFGFNANDLSFVLSKTLCESFLEPTCETDRKKVSHGDFHKQNTSQMKGYFLKMTPRKLWKRHPFQLVCRLEHKNTAVMTIKGSMSPKIENTSKANPTGTEIDKI